jgi:hypothetical protein
MGLPVEVQAKLLEQSASDNALKVMVQEIVQEVLQSYREGLSEEQRAIVDKGLKETKEKLHRMKEKKHP